MGYSLEQLQKMGAVPVDTQVASTNSSIEKGAKKSYSLEELASLGAKPIVSSINKPAEKGKLNTASGIVDAIFGSGKIGEALATSKIKRDLRKGKTDNVVEADYSKLSPQAIERLNSKGVPVSTEDQRNETADTVKGPSAGQVIGSAIQSASLFLPTTEIADVAVAAAKLNKIGKVGQILIKTGINAGEGYVGDIASNLASGEGNIFKPGAQTAIAGGIPLVGALARPVKNAVEKIGETVAPASSFVGRGIKNLVKAPLEYGSEVLAKEKATKLLPEAEQALAHSGFDDRSRKFLTDTIPKNGKEYRQMVDIAEKGANDARFASRNEPKQVLGKAVIDRIDTLQKSSRSARDEISKVAKQAKSVDIRPAVEEFETALTKRGISMGPDGKLISSGNVPTSELKYYEKAIQEVKDMTKGASKLSNQRAHQLRQRLFDTLEAEAKKGTQPGIRPFSDKVDKDVNVFRGALAKALGPKYSAAAKTFAENERVLRDISKYAGVPNDWEKLSSKDLRFGELFLRQLGNSSSKPKELFGALESLAKKRGGKHTNDLVDLADFADSLEDLYGISKARSFEGGVARGSSQGIPTLPGTVPEAIIKTLQSATRTRNEDKIKALKGVLGI